VDVLVDRNLRQCLHRRVAARPGGTEYRYPRT
jgi:hypothetical protein